MKKLFTILSTLFILLTPSKCVFSQIGLYSGFDSVDERKDWNQFRLQTAGEFNEWSYVDLEAFSKPSCLYHNYPVGGQSITEDWFVSPKIDLSSDGVIDSIRYRFSGFGTPQIGDTVAVYILVGSQDPSQAEQMVIYDFRGEDYIADAVWRVLKDLPLPALGSDCYIGFRYQTTNNWLDVRFDNVAINSSEINFVGSTNKEISLKVYPNPTSGGIIVHHNKLTEGELNIYDLTGKLIFTQLIDFNNKLRLNLPPAVYTYKVQTKDSCYTGRLISN